MLADTHCHLDFPEFDQDRKEVIRRARDAGVDYIIDVGSSLDGSRKALGLAAEYDVIYATVGLHPHEADKFNPDIRDIVRDLAKQDKVVAIGETGLDYYRNYSGSGNQKILFEYSVSLSQELGLPLIIHNRQAETDTLEILKKASVKKAVVHCFSGDEIFLKECLDLGFFVSFTCNITYKKAASLRNLVKITPLERLLLETDAPFLSPEGFRGKRNEPMFVKHLAQEIAGIKEMDVLEVCRLTTDNARKFFNLK